jgi:hypothetical protein
MIYKRWSFSMVTATVKTKRAKTSRGMRKHVRRVKQEARKMGLPDKNLKKKLRAQNVVKDAVPQ